MSKEVETVDFSCDPPALLEAGLLKKIRSAFVSTPCIHVFFTGAKFRIIRNGDTTTKDKAYKDMPAKLLGVHNKKDQGQLFIEREIVNYAKTELQRWYG